MPKWTASDQRQTSAESEHLPKPCMLTLPTHPLAWLAHPDTKADKSASVFNVEMRCERGCGRGKEIDVAKRKNKGVSETEPTWHLAGTERELAFAEFQHALICLGEAFYRFIGKTLNHVTQDPNFTGYDGVILHAIRTADRPKSVTELQEFTNRSDVANIQYSVRKLERAGLIAKVPRTSGRGTKYQVTKTGREVVHAYAEYRRALLDQFPEATERLVPRLSNARDLMVILTGLYDQASRLMSTR
jgi:predicted MarR family transcription regulator